MAFPFHQTGTDLGKHGVYVIQLICLFHLRQSFFRQAGQTLAHLGPGHRAVALVDRAEEYFFITVCQITGTFFSAVHPLHHCGVYKVLKTADAELGADTVDPVHDLLSGIVGGIKGIIIQLV